MIRLGQELDQNYPSIRIGIGANGVDGTTKLGLNLIQAIRALTGQENLHKPEPLPKILRVGRYGLSGQLEGSLVITLAYRLGSNLLLRAVPRECCSGKLVPELGHLGRAARVVKPVRGAADGLQPLIAQFNRPEIMIGSLIQLALPGLVRFLSVRVVEIGSGQLLFNLGQFLLVE